VTAEAAAERFGQFRRYSVPDLSAATRVSLRLKRGNSRSARKKRKRNQESETQATDHPADGDEQPGKFHHSGRGKNAELRPNKSTPENPGRSGPLKDIATTSACFASCRRSGRRSDLTPKQKKEIGTNTKQKQQKEQRKAKRKQDRKTGKLERFRRKSPGNERP